MENNILKITFVIIGALIGAGFASGQEIYIFFFSYGTTGILGIIISSILLGIVIYKALIIIIKNNVQNYEQFLEYIIHRTNNKPKKYIIKTINIIINIFILITFFVMIAGFGTYLSENIGIPKLLGSSILAVLCILVLIKEIKGIVKISEIIVPILITFIIIIGINSLKELDILNIENYIMQIQSNWLISGILYTSYNTILLIPVLISISKIIQQKQIAKISIIVTIITIILALSIYISMVKIDVNIQQLEMPISYVISTRFPQFQIIYGMVILSSILTTAISLGAGLLQNICKTQKSKMRTLIIICIISIPISQIGFSKLIQLLYPTFGYLGLLQISKFILYKKHI